MSEERVSDAELRELDEQGERSIAPYWGNDHVNCADLADDLRDARARIAQLEAALRLIADGSPPDEWKWKTPDGIRCGYGRRGDQDYVEAPAPTDRWAMHIHGWAVGRWEAAKLARAALKQEKP